MSAPTNLILLLGFICCVSRLADFLLTDIQKVSSVNDHQISLFSEISKHHSLVKIAKCTFSDDGPNYTEIICERLARVKTDKWYDNLRVDDIFLRTQFTFKVSEEDNISAKHFDARNMVNRCRESSMDTGVDCDSVLGTGEALVDEIYVADISQVEKRDENKDFAFTVGIQNNTGNNEKENNTNSKLVTLTKLKLQKVEDQYLWDNATLSQIKKDYIFFLFVESEQFVWDMEFNSSFPVGSLNFNEDCFLRTRNYQRCFSGIRFLEEAMPLGKHRYRLNLWRQIVGHEMSMNKCGLSTAYTTKPFVSDIIYLRHILNSVGFTELRITGRFWPEMPQIMANLSTLLKLDLSSNRIETFTEDFFLSALNVEELILAKNNLKELPQGIALLQQLKHLDLSENPLQYINSYQEIFTQVVYNLRGLQRLLLSNTPLKSLKYLYGCLGPQESASYTARIHLLELDLSFCAITTLSDVSSVEIFGEQTSLQSVNLSGNKISSIPPQLFDDLSDLRRLNISFLNLADGPKLVLASNIILELIDLSHNRLTNPGNVLASGVVLSMDLSFNHIQQWQDSEAFTCKTDHFSTTTCFNSSEIPQDSFSENNFKIKTVWVKYINLSHNSLTTVSTQMGASLNRLAEVDLGSNPFNCNNCTLIEFKKWLLALENKNVTSTEYLILGKKRMLACTEPFHLKGSFVHDVDFDPKFCVREPDKDWLIHVIIVSTILIIVIIISATTYIYRYEVTYLCHLIKIMRKRRANGTSSLEDFEYDAFVCYSGSDRAWVISELLPKLENAPERYRLCLHERDFILGSYITHNIVNSMHCSKHTVIVLTDSFVRSQWCRWELEMANHRLFEGSRDFLILLELERLESTAVPRHLRYLMDTRTYLEWPANGMDTSSAWRRLKTRLGTSIYQQEEGKEAQS